MRSFILWMNADVTIDLLCPDLLGGADIGGRFCSWPWSANPASSSAVARKRSLLPYAYGPANRRTLCHESRLSVVVSSREEGSRSPRAAGRRRRRQYSAAACHAQRAFARVGRVSAGGVANPGCGCSTRLLRHVVVRGVADVVLDDGVVCQRWRPCAQNRPRCRLPAVGIDRRLKFTSSVVPLQRVELTTAGLGSGVSGPSSRWRRHRARSPLPAATV